jgi:hypothetical protein
VSLNNAVATPTAAGRALGLDDAWGPDQPIEPLFTVVAAPDETLATYADGSPAVALRRSANGLDVFVGVPQLTPELVRALARLTGVHRFTQGNATLWAAEGFVSFQAHEDGLIAIDTDSPGPVYDALDGTPLGNSPEVTLTVRKGEVRVLRY